MRPRGGGLQRRRPHRPGRRQLRLRRRVGVAGQRRRHLPGPGAVRGGGRASRPRGGGLQRRRPHRPGRRQPPTPTTCRCCWATATAPSRTRCGTRRGPRQSPSWRGTSTATAAPTWPSPTSAPTTCRCCWATATAPSRTRCGTRRGPSQSPSWRGTSTATAAPTWPSPTAAPTTCRCCWATATAPSRTRCGTRRGTAPYALVAGDFNGDGRTDLAVANIGSNDVSVLLGNGDGTFQDQVRYAAGDEPFALVAGDFNGDGRTDLAVANAGSNDVSVLLGNGDGTFQDQVRYAAGDEPFALVAGDFNGDGRTDLAVANYDSGDVSVLLGNGDGTFQDQVRYAAGDRASRPRGGGLQRRRPHRPGRRQPLLQLQRRVGVAGQRRRHLPGPGAVRGGDRAIRPRGGGLQRRRPHRPGRRQLLAPTTCRCC